MNVQAKHFYDFGPFRLDVAERLLLRDGESLTLPSKAFETLLALVENSGHLLNKEDLMKRLWPDTFVEEANLANNISLLRRVLGDDAQVRQYIETVPKRGYRFVAGVKESSEESAELMMRERTRAQITIEEEAEETEETTRESHAEKEEVTQRQTVANELTDVAVAEEGESKPAPVVAPAQVPVRPYFRLIGWTFVTSMVALAVLAILAWWQPRRSPQPPTQRLVSTFPGAHTAASFSPDGSMIAFAQLDATGSSIWVKNLAQGDPIQIVTDGSRPRWSPRNDQILFERGRGWTTIWSVPPLGGPARLLIGGGRQPDGSNHPEGGRNPSFSGDGSRIVFERAGEIWTANSDGGDQRKVLSVGGFLTPTFSPDGSLIAYFLPPGGGPIGDIWVVPSQGGKPRQLTFDNDFCATPVWTPDGDHLIFSSRRRGSQTLWKVPAAGGEPQPVLVSAGEDTNPEVSRDGTKLIYTTTRNLYTLTVLDLATQQTRELREVRAHIMAPVFSPAGDKIAFLASVGDGDLHLFIIDADGGSLTQVTKGKGERNIFPRWSRDGSALYFYQERPVPSFRKTSIQGGQSVELARGWTFSSHWLVHVDPQEKLIAYSQSENGLVVGTFLREIATGRDTLFKKQLYEPQWSQDGQWILGAEVNSGTRGDVFGDILICSVATAECRKLATRGNRPVFSHDGSRIYFHRFKGSNRDVYSVSIDGADEKLVAELKPLPPYNNFTDVSPKGEVVYIQFKPGKPELWMTELK